MLFTIGLPGILVSSHHILPNGNLTPTRFRFAFSGGTNVTLEGSQDPNWGWVNANGQKVGENLLIIGPRIPYRYLSVVGRNAGNFVTGEPSTRVGFHECYEWRDYEHEAVASEYLRCTTSTTVPQYFVT